jgi:hypothetical protein
MNHRVVLGVEDATRTDVGVTENRVACRRIDAA